MASPRKPRTPRPAVPVVRREPSERKRLPPELEAFARGDAARLPRPKGLPREPALRDPRVTGLVPGVANRDARLVCDARIDELVRLLETSTVSQRPPEVARKLAEAEAVGLHRGRSLVSFEALTGNVLGLSDEEAASLLETGRAGLGLGERRLSEAGIAGFFRTEAALRELGFTGEAMVRRDATGREHLVLDVPVKHAPEALEAIGQRMSPLARDMRGG